MYIYLYQLSIKLQNKQQQQQQKRGRSIHNVLAKNVVAMATSYQKATENMFCPSTPKDHQVYQLPFESQDWVISSMVLEAGVGVSNQI